MKIVPYDEQYWADKRAPLCSGKASRNHSSNAITVLSKEQDGAHRQCGGTAVPSEHQENVQWLISINFWSKVNRRFDSVHAVNDVSLEIPDGEFFTLLGPSGCGKTTLMRMVAGFGEYGSG